mmetsp:Transcript_25862/g.40568  ORF Transcript_25862/g.40568 Transcript_25862/m.40568 type:complete len:257 (-) Transcript_25862:817-1587(-)
MSIHGIPFGIFQIFILAKELSHLLLERSHTFLGLCKVRLSLSNLACASTFFLSSVTLTLNNILTSLLQATPSRFQFLLRSLDFSTKNLHISLLCLDGVFSNPKILLKFHLCLSSQPCLLIEFVQPILESNFFIIGDIEFCLEIYQFCPTLLETFAELVRLPHVQLHFLLHFLIHRPRTFRSRPLQFNFHLINFIKLIPFLLQLQRSVNSTLKPLPRFSLHIILLHNIIMNIGITTIQPLQFSRLGKEFILILRLSS